MDRRVRLSGRLVTAAVALALLATACTPAGEEPQEAPRPRISITPAPGESGVAPNTPVRVAVEDGVLTDVTVEQAGREQWAAAEEEAPGRAPVAGTLAEDGSAWVSDRNLAPGGRVAVYATARGADGEHTEVVSSFATHGVAKDARLAAPLVLPQDGQTVGVGMPVVVTFEEPVEHREQVENSMHVTSEKPTEGAWNWVDETTAVFRPREYWEPHQKVVVDLRLTGVEAADGVFGTADERIGFEVGRELVATMHVPDHRMDVEVDGERVRSIPVSNGKGERRFNTTTSGVHVLMEKYSRLVMDSSTVGIPEGSAGYYRLDVDWAVRTSDSGEFAHAAPWNGSIGHANRSNGCTNMSVADARWFHDNTLTGDVLETTGTGRDLEWDNGWGFYQRSWEAWLEHSETGAPQDTAAGSPPPGGVHGDDL
ncbi:Lipoprotein-anchoring transpeptidase ErfK/SrfK [Nocardiopsis flavescens]|uniref:Lipoprotein-anchoring transpeptidase ErfK/SrfK n=1 Tax=Nocardiopsis flavescens TaxID=758803 RepID=A0A1M6RAH2_9ACTN|nr:Ig-like domain-containing protein [Nocardiopsis flavescens]SHK29420.1 Lipoprotein-anchoring transpeptidase ErfK/SrfK [Nocardiopsis flavescens]